MAERWWWWNGGGRWWATDIVEAVGAVEGGAGGARRRGQLEVAIERRQVGETRGAVEVELIGRQLRACRRRKLNILDFGGKNRAAKRTLCREEFLLPPRDRDRESRVG